MTGFLSKKYPRFSGIEAGAKNKEFSALGWRVVITPAASQFTQCQDDRFNTKVLIGRVFIARILIAQVGITEELST
jgi:hypothetical protein